jgi:hypothetical protein
MANSASEQEIREKLIEERADQTGLSLYKPSELRYRGQLPPGELRKRPPR